jgi:hypothetical protein
VTWTVGRVCQCVIVSHRVCVPPVTLSPRLGGLVRERRTVNAVCVCFCSGWLACLVRESISVGAFSMAPLALPVNAKSTIACQEEGGALTQERMSPARRKWRQGLFKRHVSTSQPSWHELLASAEVAPRPGATGAAPVTVILNHWKRHTLCRQVDALLAQTSGPPAQIWICLFASPMAADARAAALAYNDSRIAVIESPFNFKYFGRFQLALAATTRYVLVFDDDMVPGRQYLATLLHTASTGHARGALLGSIGWLLPRPQPAPDLRLASYRSLHNDSGGLYVPDLAYDILVERLLEVDYLCSLWFMETRMVRTCMRRAGHPNAP